METVFVERHASVSTSKNHLSHHEREDHDLLREGPDNSFRDRNLLSMYNALQSRIVKQERYQSMCGERFAPAWRQHCGKGARGGPCHESRAQARVDSLSGCCVLPLVWAGEERRVDNLLRGLSAGWPVCVSDIKNTTS